MTRKIKNAPGWLGLSEDRTSFVYLPHRADIVRQIFELSISGLGGYTIAKLLNSRGIRANFPNLLPDDLSQALHFNHFLSGAARPHVRIVADAVIVTIHPVASVKQDDRLVK